MLVGVEARPVAGSMISSAFLARVTPAEPLGEGERGDEYE